MSVSTYPDKKPVVALGHGILAVFQSVNSTGCDIQIPRLGSEILQTHLWLFFDPVRDTLTAHNVSSNASLHIKRGKTGR